MADAQGKTLPELQGEHFPAPRGRRDQPEGELQEQSSYRNYVRDLILGLNDGVVSVYAIVAGVAGAQLPVHTIAVVGVAATVAGALSMGLGEYISTKSQAQYYAAEAHREREHIRAYPELEHQELRDMLAEKGYPPELQAGLLEHLSSSEDRFVDFMMREEFGVGKESRRSPWAAMGLVMAAFVLGALLSVLPFSLGLAGRTALYLATGLSLFGLFAGGAIKGRVSGLSPWKSGLEMLLLGAVAGAITYGVGIAFHAPA